MKREGVKAMVWGVVVTLLLWSLIVLGSRMHVEDLIRVEAELGYRYEINEPGVAHYQSICPPCRRALFALAQGKLWQSRRAALISALHRPRRRLM